MLSFIAQHDDRCLTIEIFATKGMSHLGLICELAGIAPNTFDAFIFARITLDASSHVKHFRILLWRPLA
jgi:hypothetical protein